MDTHPAPTVTSDSAVRLAEFAHRELGESLRTVVVVTEARFDPLYLREDLAETYTEETFSAVVQAFRAVPDDSLEGQSPLGERHSVVHYYENAFVFQFDTADRDSVLLSVQSDVGTGLGAFIDDCRDRFS